MAEEHYSDALQLPESNVEEGVAASAMFHDPNMPDFDAMSQDELIAWLEKLAQRQRDEAAASSPENEADSMAQATQFLPKTAEGAWSQGLAGDEALRQERFPRAEYPLQPEQQLDAEDDDETPTALSTIADSGSDDTTDPLTWLEGSATEAEPGKDAASAERVDRGEAPDHLEELESAAVLEDPLEWLDSLANEISEAAAEFAPSVDAGALAGNGDDAYEDDASYEDESLYSPRSGESVAFPETLIGLDEPVADDFNTQSMAPVPDFLVRDPVVPESDHEPLVESESAGPAAPASPVSPVSPKPHDSLTHAFLMQDQQAELEAWYAERLRAVAAASDTASQPAGAPAPGAEALKPPPPGLAAGFNTARGKIADGKLKDALDDYETLLRANIGLDLVVSDMQWLIKQAQHQDNPAVHRVLGDALMRQGQLQQALDVYRHALQLL